MRTFKDLQGKVWTLTDCVMLDNDMILGFVVGSGATKIFSKEFEIITNI